MKRYEAQVYKKLFTYGYCLEIVLCGTSYPVPCLIS